MTIARAVVALSSSPSLPFSSSPPRSFSSSLSLPRRRSPSLSLSLSLSSLPRVSAAAAASAPDLDLGRRIDFEPSPDDRDPILDSSSGTGGGGGGDRFDGSGNGGGGGGGGGDGEDEEEEEGEEQGKEKKKMLMSQKFTLVYAALVGVGGIMGFVKSGSMKSAAAGGISSLLLCYVYTQLPTNPTFAASLGLGISGALLTVMGSRFKKSGKIFPAGVVSLVSLFMTGGYLHGILRGH